MEKLICRLLPFEISDGPTNMATDEVLLQSAVDGIATLRFYGWSRPTLSLGYFQSSSKVRAESGLSSLPFVRRPSGGGTLVHHFEVTYSICLPAGTLQQGNAWPLRMHRIIVTVLARLGVEATLFDPATSPAKDGPLCFHRFTYGDVIVGGAKVVGSAQRKHRGAILQHGGVLLATSAYTPSLPGICELCGSNLRGEAVQKEMATAFEQSVAVRLIEQPLTDPETDCRDRLFVSKYTTAAWNCKR